MERLLGLHGRVAATNAQDPDAQRMHWVSVGKRTGLPSDCDTFAPGGGP